jgi:hypothetical protein
MLGARGIARQEQAVTDALAGKVEEDRRRLQDRRLAARVTGRGKMRQQGVCQRARGGRPRLGVIHWRHRASLASLARRRTRIP